MANRQITDQLAARWRHAARYIVLDSCADVASNFLSTWAAWRADPKRAAQLHYCAAVGNVSALSAWQQPCADSPELVTLIEELHRVLPPCLPGFHRLLLDHGHVVLTLMIGAIGTCTPQVQARVDAFFVGAQHRDNWADTCGKLAAQDAILFCEKIDVNQQAQFEQAGFVFVPVRATDDDATWLTARFAPRWQRPVATVCSEHKAIVIGAGLAGSAACERLAARGWQLVLIERHAQPAQEASGNLAGIFMPLLAQDDNAAARLTRAAYLFAQRLWQHIGGIGKAFPGESCGVLHLARDAAHAQAQQATMTRWKLPSDFVQWLETGQAAGLLGHTVPNGGCFYPQAGWADPARLCQALLNASAENVEKHFTQTALQLEYIDGQWHVRDVDGVLIACAPNVILANGLGALTFSQTQHLPLNAIRGQVTNVAANALPEMPVVVCRDGYITRPSHGMCSIGASYDADADAMPRRSSDVENCLRLNHMLPDISLDLDHVTHQSRVAFRCVSPDRLPLVGALPDATAVLRGDRLRDVPRLPGLYGLLGYASRGLIWSSLAAELLAAQLEGEPLPLERELVDALDPARFLLKKHRKNAGSNGG